MTKAIVPILMGSSSDMSDAEKIGIADDVKVNS